MKCEFGARYYDPSEGRFLSEDPIGFSGGDWNLYRYVENGPIRFSDPLGLLRYNAPPPRTVPVTGETLEFAQCLEKCAGFELEITGGAETFGHSEGSAHYSGKACDFSKKKNPYFTPVLSKFCFAECAKSNYWGQPEPGKDAHYHFQIIPGKGGAVGY